MAQDTGQDGDGTELTEPGTPPAFVWTDYTPGAPASTPESADETPESASASPGSSDETPESASASPGSSDETPDTPHESRAWADDLPGSMFGEVTPPGARHPDSQRLGVFEPLLALLTACAGGPLPAGAPLRPRLVVFAGDHAVADLGLSAAPRTETAARINRLTEGVGAVPVAAEQAGVGVRCVDLTGTRTGRIDQEDALRDADLLACVRAGRDAANREIDAGADLLVGSVGGVGVSTPAAVLAAALTGMEPVDATSRGSGINDAAWIRKVGVVRDALYRATSQATDAVGLLRIAGGADLAALTGFIAQAAVRRTPVLVDDVPSTVCAVLANRLAPGADEYVVATSLAPERAHRRLLDVLGRDPLNVWRLGVGGGFAALLMVPVLRAVVAAAARPEDGTRTGDAISLWDPELL